MIAVLVGCAKPLPLDPPQPADREYTIWLGGARVGTATETEAWSQRGVVFRRSERMRFLRGNAAIELATVIDIDADPQLAARSVTWSEQSGGESRGARAVREPGGWHVSLGSAPLPAAATPAELVPLIVRRDGGFAGTVFLPARGFVAGNGRIDRVAPSRFVAWLALAGGALVEATIDVDRDGSPSRVVDGDGVIAIRATAQQAAEPFPAVDVIAATALPIAGPRGRRLVLDSDVTPPALPGQHARATSDGIELELDAHLPGELPSGPASRDRTGEIRALVAQVRHQITPDLAAAPGSPRDAGDAAAGDCTTFALAYAALAAERGIASRVVTGLRVDGDRLLRHRWTVSWTGRGWIAVDAAFGSAPAGGNLIGLAVGDADDASLIAGEAALAGVRAAAWR